MENLKKKNGKTWAVITAVILVIAALSAFVLVQYVIPEMRLSRKYGEAVSLQDKGEYYSAISAFEEIEGYKDSTERIETCRDALYNRAIDLYYENSFDEAKQIFSSLGEYMTSEAWAKRCVTGKEEYNNEIKFLEAMDLYENGKYEEAKKIFDSLGAFKTSGEMSLNCDKGVIYDGALSDISAGNIVEGYETLIGLGTYSGSLNKARNVLDDYIRLKLKDIKTGDTFIFGFYEQDNNKDNFREPVEWRVLARQGEKLLLVSEYGLDCVPYRSDKHNVNDPFTYDNSDIREWLNTDFLNTAFRHQTEQKYLAAGGYKDDRFFLLSVSEASYYFDSAEDRICIPTEYALKTKKAVTGENGACIWWLRDRGTDFTGVINVTFYGGFFTPGNLAGNDRIAVRPAVWIDTGIIQD